MSTNINENVIVGKSIFSPNIARRLLKMGNVIIDIKANKANHEKTVFIFRKDEKLKNDLSFISGRNVND